MHTLIKQATLCTLLFLLAAPATADEKKQLRTFHVSGTGEVSAAPDMATINTGVVTQAESAREALSGNNAAMEKIMSTLKKHDVADKDVQTTNFNVSPIYKRDNRGRQLNEIEAYRVQNTVQVHVRKLANLGKVLDALVQAGSNQISGIRFDIDDQEGLLNQARSRAIRDARSRAEIYAQAEGVKVGRVRQISEQQIAMPRPMPMGYAQAEAAVSRVPVAAGEQEIRVTVQVVYDIADQ